MGRWGGRQREVERFDLGGGHEKEGGRSSQFNSVSHYLTTPWRHVYEKSTVVHRASDDDLRDQRPEQMDNDSVAGNSELNRCLMSVLLWLMFLSCRHLQRWL